MPLYTFTEKIYYGGSKISYYKADSIYIVYKHIISKCLELTEHISNALDFYDNEKEIFFKKYDITTDLLQNLFKEEEKYIKLLTDSQSEGLFIYCGIQMYAMHDWGNFSTENSLWNLSEYTEPIFRIL